VSLTLTISRTELSLSPLVLSGNDGAVAGAGDANPIGVTNYQEPGYQADVSYADDSMYVHGSTPLAWKYQQAVMNFDIVTDEAASEAESRALFAQVRAAIVQSSYTVAVAIGGTSAGTWTCHMGSMTPNGSRTYLNVRDSDPVWSIALPCYPVPA
jgi:hypothetical protein